MFRALLVKDWGLMRVIILSVAFGTPTIIATLTAVASLSAPSYNAGSGAQTWASTFQTSVKISAVITLFGTALLSGGLIAAERQDRSLEFLACLPPRRHHHLLSKFALMVGFIVTFWLLYVLLTSLAQWCVERTGAVTVGGQPMLLWDYAKYLICVSGFGWAASSVARSVLLPVFTAMLSPLVVAPLVQGLVALFELQISFEQLREFVPNTMLGCGVAGWILGSFWYLNRKTP